MIGFIGDGPRRDPFLNLSITNHGAIAYIVTRARIAIDHRMKRKNISLINPLLNISVSIEDIYGPFANLSKKIDAGGELSLRFCRAKRPLSKVEPIEWE